MPSKRRERRREDELSEAGWFSLSAGLWLEPGEIPRNLRLISDTNFPAALVELMRRKRFDVRTVRSLRWGKLADEDLLQRVGD